MDLVCECCMFRKFEGEREEHLYTVFVEGVLVGEHILCPRCAESGSDNPRED